MVRTPHPVSTGVVRRATVRTLTVHYGQTNCSLVSVVSERRELVVRRLDLIVGSLSTADLSDLISGSLSAADLSWDPSPSRAKGVHRTSK